MREQDKNDNELLYLYRQGDEEALSLLVEKYRRIMMSHARSYERQVKTSCEIHDLYQIFVIALYNAMNSYKENMGCRFSSYFKIVMERAAFNYVRRIYSMKDRANKEALSIDQTIHDQEGIYIADTIANVKDAYNPKWSAQIKTVFLEIDKVLESVSKKEREVYRLWSEGFAYREIAILTGLEEKKIDNILLKLKKKLRTVIEY